MKRSFIFIYFFLINLFVFAQKFTAKIDDIGEYYRLTFTATSQDVSGFTPPSLQAFNVLSGPNQSTFSNFQMINGKTSHSESTTYTYILSAKKEGEITIGKASIQIGGKTFYSQPVVFNAKAGQSPSQHNSNSNEDEESYGSTIQHAGSKITASDLFIDVTPNRTRVKEQEAVLITYKVHAKAGVVLANTQLTEIPDFKGFISQEIPLPGNQIQTNIEHRNGETYRTGTILQYVLFPQKNGKIEIPSITFDCTVVQQRQPTSLADAFFNGGGNIGVQVQRKVPVTSIIVDSLPQPKPTNFSGGVGHFTIKGKLINNEIKTNDIATYRVTLEGTGNLKLISAPSLVFPKDFDTYDVKTKEAVETTSEGLKGSITYDYTFVPRNVGNYTVPAVEFVYYDLSNQKYQTIATQPLSIHVAKGERSNDDIDKQLALLKSDIRNIHKDADSISVPSFLEWGTSQFFIFHIILILLLIFSTVGLKKYGTSHFDSSNRRRYNAQKLAIKELNEAYQKSKDGNDIAFYSIVNKILTDFITSKLEIAQAEINVENIKNVLNDKGVSPTIIDLFTEVLETCQFAQYAPTTENMRDDVYHKAIQAINEINL